MAKSDGALLVDDVSVTHEEIKTMMRGFLRHKNLLQDAIRTGLSPKNFNGAGEIVFYFLFSAIKNLFEKHNALTQEMLTTELRAWSDVGAMPLGQHDLNLLFGTEREPGLIAEAFTAPKLDLKEQRAERAFIESILRRFMNARVIQQQIRATLAGPADSAPASGLESRLSRWAKDAQAVEFIGRNIENAALMPEFGEAIELPPPPIPTSMPIYDEYIGGFRGGDIVGVLGPFSGGKTTLLATTAVRMAQNFASRGEKKLSIYICYEDGAAKMNHLFWSAAAQIERKLFDGNAKFWDDFSDKDNLKEYDRRLPENKNGKIVFGERERWAAARPWLNDHFVFLDFSENSASGGYGGGGAIEVAAALERLADSRQMEIGFVAIDYAGLLINRELSKDRSTKNMEQIWRPLQQLPDNLRTSIAVPMNCTVLLAHQLAGTDIKKIPSYRYVTHLDASGSKAFAENLHSCLCINTRDINTRVSTVNWSKIRASVPRTPFGLIRMDDHVVGINLVNNLYTADEAARCIIRKGEAGFVAPGEVSSSAPRKKPTRADMGGIDTFGDDVL
jgi:hypothetical protein